MGFDKFPSLVIGRSKYVFVELGEGSDDLFFKTHFLTIPSLGQGKVFLLWKIYPNMVIIIWSWNNLGVFLLFGVNRIWPRPIGVNKIGVLVGARGRLQSGM